MNAVDTNVLIYRLNRGERPKHTKARQLLQRLSSDPTPTLLLWQVAGELVNQLGVWQNQGRISAAAAERYLRAFRRFLRLTMPTSSVLDKALDLYNRYSLSHWDSMLLGACIEAQVTVLYTEDMGAPRQIDTIQLVNPFI